MHIFCGRKRHLDHYIIDFRVDDKRCTTRSEFIATLDRGGRPDPGVDYWVWVGFDRSPRSSPLVWKQIPKTVGLPRAYRYLIVRALSAALRRLSYTASLTARKLVCRDFISLRSRSSSCQRTRPTKLATTTARTRLKAGKRIPGLLHTLQASRRLSERILLFNRLPRRVIHL